MSLNAARPRLRGSGGPGSASTGGGRTRRRPDRERSQLTTSGVPRSLGADHTLGITQTLRRQLGFAKTVGLNNVGTGYVEGFVYLNSAYAIDTSANAVGFAKYMQFYTKCFVVSSRYRVSFALEQAANGPLLVGATTTTNTTSLASVNQAIEIGLGKHRYLGRNPDSCTISGAVNHAAFLGKPNYLDDPQLFCTSGALPGQVVVLHYWTGSVGFTGVAQALIEVVQDVIFTDPIPFT